MTPYVAVRLNARLVSTSFSYSSGYFQARAYRKGTPRYDRSSTQRAAQRHGASSRLIII
jgi:hypothetical protein